jgi:hypothetical protein
LAKVDLHTPIIGEIDLDLRSLDEMGGKAEPKVAMQMVRGSRRQDHKASVDPVSPTIGAGAAGDHPAMDAPQRLDPVA